MLCTGLLLLNGCSDANQDTAEASSSSTAVTTTTTPTAAPGNKEIKPVAWHSEIENRCSTLLGDESSRYAVYAFYPLFRFEVMIYQSRPMRSASMIKVFILGKAMWCGKRRAVAGWALITYMTATKGAAGVIAGWADGTAIPISKLLCTCITESDNTATNLMIDWLGMDAINEYMYGPKATRIRSWLVKWWTRLPPKRTRKYDVGQWPRHILHAFVASRGHERCVAYVYAGLLRGADWYRVLPASVPGC